MLSRLADATRILGHLALWVGLYVAGAAACLWNLAGSSPPVLVLAFSLATAMSVYLLDRVKLRTSLLDPADRRAHPDRFAFLTRHAGRVRILGLGLIGTAMVTGWLIHPAALGLVLVSHLGVLVYAARPATSDGRTRRIKDVLLVKNLAVAASITAFCGAIWILIHLGAQDLDSLDAGAALTPIAVPGLFLLLVVLGDAMLCDLDDAAGDRAFGTRTLPVVLGPGPTWAIALGIHALAGSILLAVQGPSGEGGFWAIGVPVTTAMLALIRPRQVRDLVDLRLGLLAALAWIT